MAVRSPLSDVDRLVSVSEPDDLRIVGRRAGGPARLAQLLLDPAKPCLRAASDGDLAGADQLLDPEGPQQLDDGLDLRLLAGRLERVRGRRDVDHLGAEDVADS